MTLQRIVLHHPDCDGWLIAHRHDLQRDGIMRRLVCVTDGPVTSWVGKGVSDTSLARLATCQPAWVACDDGGCLQAATDPDLSVAMPT